MSSVESQIITTKNVSIDTSFEVSTHDNIHACDHKKKYPIWQKDSFSSKMCPTSAFRKAISRKSIFVGSVKYQDQVSEQKKSTKCVLQWKYSLQSMKSLLIRFKAWKFQKVSEKCSFKNMEKPESFRENILCLIGEKAWKSYLEIFLSKNDSTGKFPRNILFQKFSEKFSFKDMKEPESICDNILCNPWKPCSTR